MVRRPGPGICGWANRSPPTDGAAAAAVNTLADSLDKVAGMLESLLAQVRDVRTLWSTSGRATKRLAV